METEANTERNGSLRIAPIGLASVLEGARFEFWLGNVTVRSWEGDHNKGWMPEALGDDVLFRRSSSASFADALDQAVVNVPIVAGSLLNCKAKFSSLQAGDGTNITLNFTASMRNSIRDNMLLR